MILRKLSGRLRSHFRLLVEGRIRSRKHSMMRLRIHAVAFVNVWSFQSSVVFLFFSIFEPLVQQFACNFLVPIDFGSPQFLDENFGVHNDAAQITTRIE